ncbi:hypothetical protein ACWT_1988 [Actinoplanes sp. SE50]|uniref:hypothetical protein n=1 Tax=unclassified Actinoplanes TaxID=2626549 RepID=UPI00023EC238|nr:MULTISPECIES: hypothetical protein [unclassified Actinoplanes]AEV83007.1 hypothetical protein ACPL_2110 [Actinoplanes sp. SE50/110]ATO81403.1 hypothetical protein ACWT_1988 [Actinoplanes sp. SE50]SLL98810.1 hypothetical protein ACSP50_2037 [Actinoplanes sp. SE50/110]
MLQRLIHIGAAVIITAVATTGCAAPKYTYVKNSEQKTYFKVPHEWHATATGDLDDVLSGTNPDSANAAARQQMWWSVAYDADADPNAGHLLTGRVTDQPIVYARVAELTEHQRNAMSLDTLRDLFLPVTADARESAAQTSTLSGFELVRDEVLTPAAGLHGVRVVFDYELSDGVLHTFDQTALVNNTGDKLYLLIIRCSTSCYKDRSGELDTIATSFTVRSK